MARQICWGCNAEEAPGAKFGSICSICDRKDAIPACFCSEECYKSAWPEHKKWHKKHEETVAFQAESSPQLGLMIQKLEQAQLPGYVALGLRGNYEKEKPQFAVARRYLRKAEKLDPRRPDAYIILGHCFELSGHKRESLYYYAEAAEKWALDALTIRIGDATTLKNERQQIYSKEDWAMCIFYLVDYYTSLVGDDVKKPSWYSHDASLKRVTKHALDTLIANLPSSNWGVRNMSLVRGFVLSAIVCDGVFYERSNSQCFFSRTPEELAEAAECYKFYDQHGDDDSLYQSQSEALLVASREKAELIAKNILDGNEVFQYHIQGTWWCVHGLSSPVGAAMNGKVGLVKSISPEEDCIAVQVDGFPGIKLIKRAVTTFFNFLFTTVPCLL